MNINGRYMDDGEAARRFEEVRTAVSQTPFDHPLRSLFDFLIGYIDAQGGIVEDKETAEELLDLAKKTNEDYAAENLELQTKLSEVQNNPDPALAPLLALKL